MTSSPPDNVALLAELLVLPRERRLARFLELGDAEERVVALGDEAERLAFRDLARALTASEMVVELADALGHGRGPARARRARAQALAYAGRFEEALRFCDEAQRVAREAGQAVEAARARLAAMHALGELGRYAEAISAGQQAHEALVAAGQPSLAARADINLGAVYQNRDEPAKALFHLDRAAAVLAGEPELLGYVQNNRGEALLLLNDFDGAQAAFEAARAACERCNANLIAALAEGNLADLAARRGWLPRALLYFERARRRLEQDSAGGHLARLLTEQAEALETLGLVADALATYQDALPRLETHKLAGEIARAQAGLGKCHLRLGRFAEAERALLQAAERFDALGNRVARARVDLIRAEALIAQRKFDEARALLTLAADALRGRPADCAVLEHHLAQVERVAGELASAEARLTRAIETARDLDLPPLLADLLHARALTQIQAGERLRALADLQAAVHQVERVRGTLQAERFRAGFLGNRLALYQDLVLATLDAASESAQERAAPGHEPLADAFAAIEQARSRSLLDVVAGVLDLDVAAEPDPADAAGRSLVQAAARLRSELNALYSQLAERGDGRAAATPSGTLRAAIQHHERELQELENRLASTCGLSQLYAAPATLADVQSALADGEALLSYFIAAGELLALTITPDRVAVQRRLGDLAGLSAAVQRMQFQIHRAVRPGATEGPRGEALLRDARRELGALWSLLIAPLLPAIGDVRRLLIVPHGPLHLVPFHALWDGQRHLIEQYEFVASPSASLYVHFARQPPAADAGASLVIGVADQAAPQIADEARQTAAELPGARLLLNEEATAQRVLEAGADSRLVHFACHGNFSASNPMASGLKLSDRLLTLRDIYGWRLRADLVTLSGCNTGRNVVQAGDELLGLLRGFFAAGAAALLVSLWPAHDEISASFMRDFYTMWRSEGGLLATGDQPRGGKCAALRRAQLRVMSRRPHPVFWAPFVLVGKP